MATPLEAVNGWDELVALGVARRMRMIEEQPYGDIQKLYDEALERVVQMAGHRTRGAQPEVRDEEEDRPDAYQPSRLF